MKALRYPFLSQVFYFRKYLFLVIKNSFSLSPCIFLMFSQLNIEKKRRKDSFSLGPTHTDSSHITVMLKKKNVLIMDISNKSYNCVLSTTWSWKKFKSGIFFGPSHSKNWGLAVHQIEFFNRYKSTVPYRVCRTRNS